MMKNAEIYRQQMAMKSQGVIEESKADKYSQILLTPKPNGKWRFCVDYVLLNECSEREGWPIPHVEHMLRRIGEQKPKYFAVMDCTNGYHQAPLSVASRIFTAFISIFGIFQWLRVPMGLKGAPSYFQRVMAAMVLVGLIHVICELYIDDIVVFGSSFDEYLARLEQVFERLRRHRITLNPNKCQFGLREVEYVGHVINHEGTKFTPERREAVFNMELPTVAKQLKSFIGCAEYFRSHIRDLSTKLRPLHLMIQNYDRNRKLDWTQEAREAWDQIREDIRNTQTLYFLDPNAPVYLHTDASDYGLGAYLFQVFDVEHPVAFMSHLLSEAESRWNVTEKECYAIVFALKRFEHLLRDRHFTLRTDHRNLIYINNSTSPKIRRWKLELQEFDFDIEYLKGEDNSVADNCSRLMDRNPHSQSAPTNTGDESSNNEKSPCPQHYKPPKSESKKRIELVENKSGTIAQALSYLIEIPAHEEHVCAMDKFEIPTDKYKIIRSVHNSQRGHFGVERTLNKIRESLAAKGETDNEWLYMREHVKRFIRHCPCCQKMSQIKTPIETLGFTVAANEPMQELAVDSFGPLPKDKYGNEYIIAIIDMFTRWIELYATPDGTAQSALRALIQHNKTFGQPYKILSDNGSQYVNEVIDLYLKMVGTEHLRIVPHSHEENSIVERSHKETLRHLRALVFDDKTLHNWSDHIDKVQRIMNASEHESIGVSPARLLFGNAIHLDKEVYQPITALHISDRQLASWADEQLTTQQRLLELASNRQHLKDLLHNIRRTNNLRDKNTTITGCVSPRFVCESRISAVCNGATGTEQTPHAVERPVRSRRSSSWRIRSTRLSDRKVTPLL
jgi:hypothetical protein